MNNETYVMPWWKKIGYIDEIFAKSSQFSHKDALAMLEEIVELRKVLKLLKVKNETNKMV